MFAMPHAIVKQRDIAHHRCLGFLLDRSGHHTHNVVYGGNWVQPEAPEHVHGHGLSPLHLSVILVARNCNLPRLVVCT